MARKRTKIKVERIEEFPVEIRKELKETTEEHEKEYDKNVSESVVENLIMENTLPIIEAIEPKVEVKIIIAKLDCFINNESNKQFLTKDKEYVIINGDDKVFTILNDNGEHHLFLYEEAKDKFTF